MAEHERHREPVPGRRQGSGSISRVGRLQLIPVTVNVRSFGASSTPQNEKKFRFNVFVNQKWTPYLMMLTLFNSVSSLNDFADEATYRLSGKIEFDGLPNLSLSTMLAPGEAPVPEDLNPAEFAAMTTVARAILNLHETITRN